MKNRSVPSLTVICLLAAFAGPAAAYIKYPPTTLGDMCRQSIHIYVLKVEKFNAEKGIIIFKPVQQLKALAAFPDGVLDKHVIAADVKGAKVILDWAAEGKSAIMFAKIRDVKAHVYIDGYWYSVLFESKSKCWIGANGEPHLLANYCGSVQQLKDAVTKILRGEEVVVKAMVSDQPRDMEQGRAKIQDVRASLKILGAAEVRKPDRVGTVKTLAADGRSFNLLPLPTEKNKTPAAVDIQVNDRTRITAGPAGQEAGKLAVGQTVSVELVGKGNDLVAAEVRIGEPLLPEKGNKPTLSDKSVKPAATPGNKVAKPAPENNKKEK